MADIMEERGWKKFPRKPAWKLIPAETLSDRITLWLQSQGIRGGVSVTDDFVYVRTDDDISAIVEAFPNSDSPAETAMKKTKQVLKDYATKFQNTPGQITAADVARATYHLIRYEVLSNRLENGA